jgi:ubiquinone/menaquinone biosynthesis C-methylase UbiE
MEAEIDRVLRNLKVMNPLREPTLTEAVASLKLPRGSRGLDIGCGIGLQAPLLAAAVGPAGSVTGLDISRKLLNFAARAIARQESDKRISFAQGDMNRLPFADQSFDWAWSVDCAGYPAADLEPILHEITRVLRPGGVVVLLGWTSQVLLPGFPLLEARLNAACNPYVSLFHDQPPRAHFQRALYAFARVGIVDATATTFVGQVRGPLQPAVRRALALLFEMLWSEPQSAASESDLAEYRRLCVIGSPDFIGDVPEYTGFFTYTMFSGRTPEGA